MAGITLSDDSAQELKPSRIEKDDNDLSQIKESSMICGASQKLHTESQAHHRKDQLISTVPCAHHSVKGNWWNFWTRNGPLRYMLLFLVVISCTSPLIRNAMMTQLKMAEQKTDTFTNWIVDMMKRTHESYFTQTLLLGFVTIWHQWLSYEALILMSLFFVGLPNDAIFRERVKCCLSVENDGQLWDCTPLSA